jgi:hypothetical protein
MAAREHGYAGPTSPITRLGHPFVPKFVILSEDSAVLII